MVAKSDKPTRVRYRLALLVMICCAVLAVANLILVELYAASQLGQTPYMFLLVLSMVWSAMAIASIGVTIVGEIRHSHSTSLYWCTSIICGFSAYINMNAVIEVISL